MDLIRTLTNAQMKKGLPEIQTGDTVKVSAKVVEGNRERIQVFEGTVMRLRGGGLGLTITVRRIASGVGVERTFKVHSPRIEKIEVVRHGVSHRAQLYFLRDRVGKRSSLREKLGELGVSAASPEEFDAVIAATTEAPAEAPVEVAETAPEVVADAPVAQAAPAAEETPVAATESTEQEPA